MILRNIKNRILNYLSLLVPGGKSLRPWLHKMRGVKMGRNVWIGKFVYLDELHPDVISIGENTTISIRTSIISHLYWGNIKKDLAGPIKIGKNVFIGPHCVILPNVIIGDGAVIKAGTTVSRNVPPYTFWGEPSSGPISRITIPLTSHNSYSDFVAGLKPLKQSEKNNNNPFNLEYKT